MSLTALAFWLLYVGGCLAAVFNPIFGLMLYIFVYHVNPETQWWGSSVVAVGLRCSMTVALATGLGMLLHRPPLPRGARQFPLPYLLAILFGLLAAASLTWGVETCERGLYQAEKFGKILILLFILLRCVRTPREYQLVFIAWLAGVFYVGYYAQHGIGLRVGGRLTAGLGGPDFEDSSDLAVHLVATLPLIGAAFFMARTWLGRLAALVTGALAVNTLIMTRTRNAVVGVAAMAVVGVCSLPRGYRLKGLAAVAAGMIAAAALTDPAWWMRMASLKQYRFDDSAVQRLALWQAALDMAVDHPLGIGLGNYHELVKTYVPGLAIIRGAHSSVMACLAELGWLGLALYLATFAAVLWRLGRVRRAARDLPEFAEVQLAHWRTRFHLGWHAMALRTGLVGYFCCGLFTTRLLTEDFWVLVGLSLCLHNVACGLAAEREETPEPQPGRGRALPAGATAAGPGLA